MEMGVLRTQQHDEYETLLAREVVFLKRIFNLSFLDFHVLATMCHSFKIFHLFRLRTGRTAMAKAFFSTSSLQLGKGGVNKSHKGFYTTKRIEKESGEYLSDRAPGTTAVTLDDNSSSAMSSTVSQAKPQEMQV